MEMTSSEEASCSDCRIEMIQRTWSDILLKWLNKCVHPEKEVRILSPYCLADIMNKYKKDICENDVDRAILCTDDIEPFIKYKYPLLRLRYLAEASDYYKKQYIMVTVLLFHCCVKSQSGVVHADICKMMNKYEQEVILKFCERLDDMEITVNNVDCAIKEAFDYVKYVQNIRKITDTSSSEAGRVSTDQLAKSISVNLSSDGKLRELPSKLSKPSTYNSSVTVLPTVVTDTSTYSDLVTESESSVRNRFVFTDSEEVNVYPIESKRSKNRRGDDDQFAKQKHKAGRVDVEIKHRIKNYPPCCPNKRAVYVRDGPEKEVENQKDNIKQDKEKNAKKTRMFSPKNDTKGTKDKDKQFAETKHAVADENKTDKRHNVVNAGDKYEDQPVQAGEENPDHRCLESCSCSKCMIQGTWCGDPNNLQKEIWDDGLKEKGKLQSFICACEQKLKGLQGKWANMSKKKKIPIAVVAVLLLILIILACVLPFVLNKKDSVYATTPLRADNKINILRKTHFRFENTFRWICKNNICQKVYVSDDIPIFSSLSRCTLICMGPQLWPYPIGYTFFSKKIVALATNKMEYKFQSIPSEAVHQYLAEAFKLFVAGLARLEKIDDQSKRNATDDLTVKRMTIQIDVETDPEPRLRVNTEESYHLKIDTKNNRIVIKISSASFCGVRHGLETLNQMILLDQNSGHLITLSNAVIKDAPTYKYRGLMIDTARNYIPVVDLMRTVDAMATVKLNTFHWRISDVTSFPLYLPKLPELFEHGAYDRSLVYTKQDVKYLVNRAGVRGIRVLMEVAAPGPVGRAWSWHPEVSCPSKTMNFTCNNALCLRLNLHDSILDILQAIYGEILEMTKIDDVFHLSDGVFGLSNCHYLIDDRQGFLDKVLERLKRANKGFLPKLPIIWHTAHLTKDSEAKTWEQYGVQLAEIPRDPADVLLSKFRVIHSGKWDLSCEMNKNRCTKYRTWQEMYSWKSWRNIEVFTIEGGEAMLWTDLVNSGNLDSHIWPRAAAVAERLWSDMIANTTASSPVYTRLDSQRFDPTVLFARNCVYLITVELLT